MNDANLFSSSGYLLSNVDYYQFVADQVNRIKGFGPAILSDSNLCYLVANVLLNAEEFNRVMQKTAGCPLSEEIGKLEIERNVSINALRTAVECARFSTDMEKVSGATCIIILLDRYGDFSSINFDKEGLLINKLLAYLSNATYKPLIEQLNLTEYVVCLSKRQKKLMTICGKSKNASALSEFSQVREFRMRLNDKYTVLCSYILAMAKMKSDEQYTSSLQVVNGIRNEYNVRIARNLVLPSYSAD